MTGSFSKNKLESMEKLNKSKKKFKFTSMISLVTDVVSFYIFSILRYLYKLHESSTYDFILLMNTLIIQLIINIVLFVLVLKDKRRVLLIFMLIYIVLGTSYAIIVIILHFQTESNENTQMESSYYDNYIFLVVIIFDSLSWLCKACASISIGLFYFFNENFENEFESTNNNKIEYQGKRTIPQSKAAKASKKKERQSREQTKNIQQVYTESFMSTISNKYDETPETESREIHVANDSMANEQRKSHFLEKIHQSI